MKSAVMVLLACAACGKGVGKDIEKVNDGALDLAAKTDAVCSLVKHLDNNEASNALSEHTRKLLMQRQADKVALKAQLDCIATELTASYGSSFYAYSENLPRAYAKDPSEAVTASFKIVDVPWLRKQVSQYLADLAGREEDIPETAEAVPRVVELMDRAEISKTWVGGAILVLWARTDNAALEKRIDSAEPKDVSEAWGNSLDYIERGPKGDRKKLVEKLFELSKARGIQVYDIGACKIAPEATGCDAINKKNDEAVAASMANTSPIVEILQPVLTAAGAADKTDKASTFQAEIDGTAPSPVYDVIPEVPEMRVAHDKIVKLGAAVHKDCKNYMGLGGAGGLVCARALGTQSLALLVAATLEHLETYNADYAREGQKARRFGKGVVIGLRALSEFKDTSVDDTYLKALSAYDPDLAKFVMDKVKARSKMDKVVDSLFQFMARKEKFAVAEIDNYVGLLTSYGAEVTPAIVKNLERELAKAKKPEGVYWAAKVVALFALEKVGTAAAIPVLDKYASDTSGYQNMKSNATTGTVVSSDDVPFADAVARTKAAVAAR